MNGNSKIIMVTMVTGSLAFSLFTISILFTNQASAQCPTSITIGAYPNKGTVGFETNTLPVSLSGLLKTCGEPMGNTFITITGLDGPDQHIKTSNSGDYGIGVRLSPGVYKVQAIYDGDEQNDPISATKTITANANPQNQ